MARTQTIRGETTQWEAPEWQPLIDLVMTSWMWMCEIRLGDGRKVHAYKHGWTRQYVHLAEEGTDAFVYVPGAEAGLSGRYRKVDALWLLEQALEPLFLPGYARMGTPPD